MTRLDPVAIGRLLGLDRAPEVRRLRARTAELAFEGRSDELLGALARRHAETHPEAAGLLYVDGHVRACHGKADLQKAHLARMRIAMPAEVDTWVSDRFGDGLLVWQAPPGQSLSSELKEVVSRVRELLGPDARPTICFDRGGWSPKLFRQLVEAGFDILTYRKGPVALLSPSAFKEHLFVDEAGREHAYLLADRHVRIAYDSGRRYFACRQVTRLDAESGHQTQVITARDDPDPGLVAHAMFSRWRQENFFRYMRSRFGLDALDSYEVTAVSMAKLTHSLVAKKSPRPSRPSLVLGWSLSAWRCRPDCSMILAGWPAGIWSLLVRGPAFSGQRTDEPP
ncbi:MAG: hypothetical protein M0Z69_15280 [Actinomycetota bacterium]|nr:hypothetical protein [Actinomycetota bacterium]